MALCEQEMTTRTVESDSRLLVVRRSVAVPLYAIALALSYLSDAIGKVAAVIARDP